MRECNECGVPLLESITFAGREIYPTVCNKCAITLGRKLQAEEKRERARRRLTTANLPRNYDSSISLLDSISKGKGEMTKAQKKIINFINNYNIDKSWELPLIFGPPGTGKTLMVYYFSHRLISMDLGDLYFLGMGELLNSYKKLMNREPTASHKTKAEFLIIDDFGAHNISSWALEKMYSLLDYRLKNRMPTLITSNINPLDLASHLSRYSTAELSSQLCVSIQDRLFELCTPMKIDGKSHRLDMLINRTQSLIKQKQTNKELLMA